MWVNQGATTASPAGAFRFNKKSNLAVKPQRSRVITQMNQNSVSLFPTWIGVSLMVCNVIDNHVMDFLKIIQELFFQLY